jgi:cell division transport system permease protein
VREKNEDPMASGLLDFNPLYISINLKLYPEYINPDSIQKVIAFIQQSNIVREVVYDKTLVSKLDSNLKKIGVVLAILAIILFVSAVVIIDNTVRLAMFSNRLLIKTMQMVGATRWFIAAPFNRRAVLTGLLSGCIAGAGLLALKYAIENQIPEIRALNDPLILALLLVAIIALGVLISLISTHRSVFKYLKLKIDDLY